MTRSRSERDPGAAGCGSGGIWSAVSTNRAIQTAGMLGPPALSLSRIGAECHRRGFGEGWESGPFPGSAFRQEAGHGKERLNRPLAEHVGGDELAEGGAVLEAVAGAAADDPEVGCSGATIHDELLVGRVFVLAHARLQERGSF